MIATQSGVGEIVHDTEYENLNRSFTDNLNDL